MRKIPHAPLLASALAVAVGIAAGEALCYFPLSTIAVLVTGLFLVIFCRQRPSTLRHRIILAGCLLLGIALHLNSLRLPQDHVAHLPEGESMIEGVISSFPEGKSDRQSFILEAEQMVIETGSRPVSGKVRITMEATPTPLRYGDHLRLTGRFHRPSGLQNPGGFDYENYLMREGIYFVGSVGKSDRVWLLGNNGNTFFRTIDEWRNRVRTDAEYSLTGPGRAIFLAMTIGDERFVEDAVRDTFMVSGTTHILSISGSHVGLIAFLLYNMVRLSFRLLSAPLLLRATIYLNPSRIAALTTIPVVVFYSLLAGAETPTVRSTIMVVVYLTAILIGRGSQPLNSLALAALFTFIFDPQALFSISFQLSFLTVLLICLAVEEKRERSLAELLEKKTWQSGARKRFSYWLRMSAAASLGTLPLVACYFNSLPWIGIIANLVIVPLAGFAVVPLGLFSAVIGMARPESALPLAGWNQHLLDIFYRTVELFAAIPGAEVHCPSPSALFVMALFGLLTLWYLTRRRLPLIGAVVSCLLIAVPMFISNRDKTTMDFVDVGQGDCSLMHLPDGKTVMIDTGGASANRFDMGRRVVAPFLWDRGIRKLDMVILSHYNADHAGGMPYLMRNFEIGEIWEGVGQADSPLRREIMQLARELHIPVRQVKQGDRINIGTAAMEILNPPSRRGFDLPDENSRSIVVRIATPDMTALLTGDVDEAAEAYMYNILKKTDVIKVPHHGSRTSSSEAFLARLRPAVAVISVGRHNTFDHPAPEVMARYLSTGARIYRTDRHGAARLRTEKTGDSRLLTVLTSADHTLRHVRWKEGLEGLWQIEESNFRKLWDRPWLWEGKGL